METFIAAPSALYTARMQTKVQASVLEAYMAGVFYDYLTSDVPGAYENETASVDAVADAESIRDDNFDDSGSNTVCVFTFQADQSSPTVEVWSTQMTIPRLHHPEVCPSLSTKSPSPPKHPAEPPQLPQSNQPIVPAFFQHHSQHSAPSMNAHEVTPSPTWNIGCVPS